MARSKAQVHSFQGKIAYPTIVLSIIAIALYVIVCVAAIQGSLAIGWTILINTVLAYFLFTSMHEAGHLNISGNNQSLRWIDEIIGWLSGIPLFAPFYTFKIIHFRHHAFTNDPEKDPDHWLASKNFIALLFHSTTIFPVYLIKGFQLLYFEKKVVKKVKKDLQIGFIGLLGLVALLIVGGLLVGWSLILQIWIVPAIIAQIFLAIAFDWLPHHPHEEKERYHNTRVFDIPGLSILLLGQNYHLIHHLHPRIPFYDYRKAYSKIEDELKEKGSEIISL